MTDTLSVGGVIHGASELNLPSVSNTDIYTQYNKHSTHHVYAYAQLSVICVRLYGYKSLYVIEVTVISFTFLINIICNFFKPLSALD